MGHLAADVSRPRGTRAPESLEFARQGTVARARPSRQTRLGLFDRDVQDRLLLRREGREMLLFAEHGAYLDRPSGAAITAKDKLR